MRSCVRARVQGIERSEADRRRATCIGYSLTQTPNMKHEEMDPDRFAKILAAKRRPSMPIKVTGKYKDFVKSR
jgi:hypothetical protein